MFYKIHLDKYITIKIICSKYSVLHPAGPNIAGKDSIFQPYSSQAWPCDWVCPVMYDAPEQKIYKAFSRLAMILSSCMKTKKAAGLQPGP